MRALLLVPLLAFGCKDKPEQQPKLGSATPSPIIVADAMATVDPGPVTMPVATDPIAQRYLECLGFSNANAWDDFRGCFARNAMYEAVGWSPATTEFGGPSNDPLRDEPQFLMTSGRDVIAIVRIAGKASGAYYSGTIITADESGHLFTRFREFYDEENARDQKLGGFAHDVVLVGKNDAGETANLASFQSLIAAHDKHDAKAFADLVADDAVWSVHVATGSDLSKSDLVASVSRTWVVFPDLRNAIDETWTAGDYVASVQTLTGTAADSAPAMKTVRGAQVKLPFFGLYRFEKGKLARAWVFYQSAVLVKQASGTSGTE